MLRDDGERFLRNSDGTYSMENSEMARPYKYTYERLLRDCILRPGIFRPEGTVVVQKEEVS